ncbi:MAG: hypothetical protein R3296_02525 [Oleiphilaceae bacterium]|nr:hypothetical protein [Oleiphilaceae bacterium]
MQSVSAGHPALFLNRVTIKKTPMDDYKETATKAEKLNRRMKAFIPASVGLLAISAIIAWTMMDAENGNLSSVAVFLLMMLNVLMIVHTHTQSRINKLIINEWLSPGRYRPGHRSSCAHRG